MTNQEQLITPSTELMQNWVGRYLDQELTIYELVTEVYKAGADQELEACCEWAEQFNYDDECYQDKLRAARRPKPLSETDLALASLEEIIKLTEKLVPRAFVDHSRYDIMRSNYMRNLSAHIENVRRTLESIND